MPTESEIERESDIEESRCTDSYDAKMDVFGSVPRTPTTVRFETSDAMTNLMRRFMDRTLYVLENSPKDNVLGLSNSDDKVTSMTIVTSRKWKV